MFQALQSTATQRLGAPQRRSDVDGRVPLDPVEGADAAVHRALERKTGSPTTGSPVQDRQNGTLSRLADPAAGGNVRTRVLDLARVPARPSPPVTLHALQEWEGYITEIGDAEVTASLVDLTAGATYAGEEATIPLEEISEADISKVQVGSIFRWVIGYERTGETKKRVSHIVFRDLPAMTESDLRDGEEWARRILAAFNR